MMKTMFGFADCAQARRPRPTPATANELAAVVWTNRRREILPCCATVVPPPKLPRTDLVQNHEPHSNLIRSCEDARRRRSAPSAELLFPYSELVFPYGARFNSDAAVHSRKLRMRYLFEDYTLDTD